MSTPGTGTRRAILRKGLTIALTMTALATSAVAVNLVTAGPASAAIVKYCRYTSAEPVLRSGSTGAAVKQVQCELNVAIHSGLVADGEFGPKTKAAVINFQRCVGIAPDGIVGPVTWRYLNSWAQDYHDSWICQG